MAFYQHKRIRIKKGGNIRLLKIVGVMRLERTASTSRT